MNKTKRRIFNTAIKLFSEKGYDNASVEEITAVAGVAKGSLYYHFPKKEDIFDMLLKEGMKLLHNNIEIKTRNCKTAFEKITEIILIQIKVMVKYDVFVNVIVSQIWAEEEKNKKSQEAVFEYVKTIGKVLREGMDNGDFYEGDEESIAASIVGVICADMLYKLKNKKQIDIDKIHNDCVNYCFKALCKRNNLI